ncbi:Mobile element protein [hydrothermal vent metagenome]|uniref:Mobile element protein n=1 Tax=hydrothermal vent metagenome TaxID=652676 RepID=A0A3B0VZL5_9ZZZZ
MIDKGHAGLSIVKQCGLLNINRSGLYYDPKNISELNLALMRLIDEHYLEHPYKGARRMHTWLTKDLGHKVSKNRIENLYFNKMSLRSILPGPHTSKRNKEHKTYPYLLRELKITKPNQVWGTDITYIPMANGFMYLIAVIDLYSRYVVHWSVSNSMEAEWCAEFIQEAFDIHGTPEILNTDQGAQFTSEVFTSTVLASHVKLSMDGKGRATDNAFIERFWRSIKYEKLYIHPPKDGVDLYHKVEEYLYYYNHERRHSSIGDEPPATRYIYCKPPVPSSRAA